MNLRSNDYAGMPEEADVVGKGVATRVPLSEAPPGNYKYVVDANGNLWVDVGNSANHSSLVPTVNDQVYVAGDIEVMSNGTVNVNAFSGHYMQDMPILNEEENAYTQAMQQTIQNAGLRPGTISPSNDPSIFQEFRQIPRASP